MLQNITKKRKKKSHRPNRGRENFQETAPGYKYRKIKKVIQKAKTEALSTNDLLTVLKGVKNFVGIFASNRIKFSSIEQLPIFLVVNLDPSYLPGSHWVALRIGSKFVEIFDSLGFNHKLWPTYPKPLINFLASFSKSHNFIISPIIQQPNTYDCGLFCLLFILLRNTNSFSRIVAFFSRNLVKNRKILYHMLLKKK